MGGQAKLDKDAGNVACYAASDCLCPEGVRTPSSAGLGAHQPNCSKKRKSFS
jgi:hypothetical protein